MIDTAMALNASASVAGSADPISVATGVPPMKLRPKSQVNRPESVFRYWVRKGSFRPRPSRMRARSASVISVAPEAIISAGSPVRRTA